MPPEQITITNPCLIWYYTSILNAIVSEAFSWTAAWNPVNRTLPGYRRVPFTEPISAWSQQRENFPHSTLPLPHTTFIAFSIASNHSSTAKLPPQGQVAMGLQNNSTSCDTNLISSTYGIDLTPLLLFSFSKLQVALNDVIHEVSIYCGHSLYLLTRWVLGNKLFISQQYSSGENIFHWKKLFFKSSLQYQPDMAKELHEGLYAVVQCTTVIHFVRRWTYLYCCPCCCRLHLLYKPSAQKVYSKKDCPLKLTN